MKALGARSLLLMVVLAGSFSFCEAQAAGHFISFNNVHHRGAHGAWAGFEHFIKGKADDRNSSRHILYGALVAGPDHNDAFLCGKEHRPWLPLYDGKGSDGGKLLGGTAP